MWAAATMIFRVLVSIEDSYQNDRISRLMDNSRSDNLSVENTGLLQVAKALVTKRSSQSYSAEMLYTYERYVDLLKELMKLESVNAWMSEHRQSWTWMERDIIAPTEAQPQRLSDFQGRREVTVVDNLRYFTDMHGIHDSEDDDDDDDSRMYDEVQRYRDEKVIVQGAGADVINGVYVKDGIHEGAGLYVKKGIWKGSEETFTLFRCHVGNNTQLWYISIAPVGAQPGTNADIDFYSAPVSTQFADYPPEQGWTKASEGTTPPPVVRVVDDDIIADPHVTNIRM
jgi:hypothetical protein